MNFSKLPKKVVAYDDATESIKIVIDDFMNSVVSTLGPMGQTTIIENGSGNVPIVTKDGVTVSESIYYEDNLKLAIATLLKEASRKTSEEVGDGTTTSMLLACSLLEYSMSMKPLINNFREYLEGISKAVDYVIEYLQEELVEIKMNSDELKAVINISSNNDVEITSTLTDITEKVGAHGIIDVKLSDNSVTSVNITDGAMIETAVMEYPMISGIFEVDGQCDIVLVEGAIEDIPTIQNLLSYYTNKNTVVIIAKEFSKQVINTVRTNNQRGVVNIVLAISEGFGNSKLEILKDLAVITNNVIFSTDGSTELPLRNFSSKYVGHVKGVTVNSREIILYCDPDNTESEAAKARFEELNTVYNAYVSSSAITSSGEYNNLKMRMSKYVSLATINVGGITKAEATEKKDRYDDAVAAISAAVNNGVLPGGGASFLRAISIINSRMDTFKGEELDGAKAIIEACTTPIKTLCSNSGFKVSAKVIEEIKVVDNSSYNVITMKIVDAYEEGILDPALVLIKALDNASAVTRSIVNSNAFIIGDNGETKR